MTPRALFLSVVISTLVALVVSRLLFRDTPGLEVASIAVLTFIFTLLSAAAAGIIGKNGRRGTRGED